MTVDASWDVPEECFNANYAELKMSPAGEPFLILLSQEGLDCSVVHLAPFLRYAATDPRLRRLLEDALYDV